MSTFTVQPNTAYNFGIREPGVSGSPAPTVSYAWTFNGMSIGGNSRFVNGYTFPVLPGTLACTITLSNIAGSVSRTVTATIQQATNLPVLSPVTIRDNSDPTEPISVIANGNTGVVLRVGGPNAPDVNPSSSNANSISYQWRRGSVNIAGATGQTYTLVEADENQTISVLVTATNLDGSTSRSAVLVVGDALPNAVSHVGMNAPGASYFTPGQHFANLWSRVRNSNFLDQAAKHLLGGSWGNWTGPATFSALGWPVQTNTNQSLNEAVGSTAVRGMFPYILHEVRRKEALWDVLGLKGNYEGTIPDAWMEGTNPNYTNPPGIERNVTFDVAIYWRGTGTCNFTLSQNSAAAVPSVPSNSQIEEVVFTGPNNEGPWGLNNEDADYNGPATMKRVKRSCSVDSSTGVSMRAGVATSSASDPVRDIILLVSNVRDADTGELLFEGYDHTNYRPFQIHIPFYERTKSCRVARSLSWGLSVNHFDQLPDREHIDYNATPVPVELQTFGDPFTWQWSPPRWTHSHPSGMNRGLGSISHPGHSLFHASPRALAELCNQLNADLWWCHSPAAVYPGTRVNGVDTPCQGLEDKGNLLVDVEHINGLATVFDTYLKPGLQVWNEYGNEVWNSTATYSWGTNWGYAMSGKVLASEEFGGDGLFWAGTSSEGRVLQAPAIHAGGETIKFKKSFTLRMFQASASALITKQMRDHAGANGREFLGVVAGQSSSAGITGTGLSGLFLTQPKLFKYLDKLAHAPYRNMNWNPNPLGKHSTPEADINLENLVDPNGDGVAESIDAAWDWIGPNQRAFEPYAIPFGGDVGDLNPDSWWGTRTINGQTYSGNWGLFTNWKSIAIDEPQPDNPVADYRYKRLYVPPGWGNRQRWHLDLLSYEAGNHYKPVRSRAKLFTFQVMLDPRYRTFQRRYLETYFAPFKKGLFRDAQTPLEEEIYLPGRVPAGISTTEREPIHSVFTALAVVSAPDYKNGMYWGQQWWLGHDGAPQYEVLKECAEQGWGEPNWWLTYTGDSE